MVKKINYPLLLILFFSFGLCETTFAQTSNKKIVLVGVYDNPPKIFQDKNGKPDGVFIDILKAIEQKENLKFEYKYDTWDNLYNDLKSGKIDVLPDVVYSEERAAIFTLSKLPTLTSWLELFSRNDLNVQSISDLQNLKIGVLNGSIQEIMMREFVPLKFKINYKIITYKDYSSSAHAIKNKEIDVLVADRFFTFSNLFDNRIKPTGIIIRPSGLHFAFPKNKDPKLVELFDRNISRLKNDADSAYYKSLFKWLDKDANTLIPTYVRWLFLTISLILILTISFVLLLRKRVKIKTKELFEAKDKAEKSEQQLKSIANNIVNGMIYQVTMFDERKIKFTYLSDTVLKLYGCTAEEAMENPDLIYGKVHPEDIPALIEEEKKALQNMSIFKFETRVINPDGSIRWSYYISKPRKIDGVICWDGIEIDISDRKNMEMELKISKEKAEESDLLKSAFLANMSHEIRTPMNGILGFAELLKDGNLKEKDQKKYIQIIEKSGKRMLNIINDIMDISKIEAGLMEIHLQESNINDKLECIRTLYNPQAEKKGLILTINNSLPINEAIIITDREKLFAILTNLLNNAIKHTNEGSIEIGYTVKDELLEFFIKDTGVGIPKERQQAIFRSFIQGDITNKMAIQGAGLGLSITKAFVEMLGGTIWLESETGKGSTFYFTIKYQKENTLEKSQILDFSQLTNETLTNKLKILIVEDDKMSELLLTKLVKKFSKEILKARDGFEAVNVCINNPDIDLILMDIQMPNMNGHEATKAIRNFNKEVIIIAQTAYALLGDKEKAIKSGCNACIAKPIDQQELFQLLLKYFKSSTSI